MRRVVFLVFVVFFCWLFISVIANRSMNLNAEADQLDVSRPAISKHIKILTQCGLISIKQIGRERYCEAKLQTLNEVSQWVEQYCVFWNQKLDALEELLANEANNQPVRSIKTKKK